jgi:outer membrane protein TolC
MLIAFGASMPALSQAPAPVAGSEKKNHQPASQPSSKPARKPVPTTTSPLELNLPKPPAPVPAFTTTPPASMTPTPSDADKSSTEALQKVIDEATINSGAIIVDPEQVVVKPPLLSALIRLDRKLSPLQLDAFSSKEIGLREALTTALASNLTIKISQADMESCKWNYYGALGQFLPGLNNEVNFSALNGNYVSPAGLVIPIKNPFLTTSNNFTQPLFRGGSILYGALQNKHIYKASQYQLKGTINEMLYDAAKRYYNLAYNDVMLQIRVKAVEVAQGLVIVQQDLYDNGVNTQLDVLQAKYELSNDRQKLIQQQVERRQAAVNLATLLNANSDIDLELRDRQLTKVRLVDNTLSTADLLKIAINNRPELKLYEQKRLAAKDAVKVARAALFPMVNGVGTIIGSASNAQTESQLTQSSQQTPLSGSGVGVGPIVSALSAPLSPPSNSNGSSSWSMRPLFEIGVDITYNLGGMGVPEMAQVENARWQARKAQLEFNRTLEQIYGEVRDAYLSSMSAENLILETTDAVRYAEEGLRVAVVRLKDGVGTYLEVIQAQRNYTDSLINKANAIIKYNLSQAQLLHAMGRMTVDTLTATTPLRQ